MSSMPKRFAWFGHDFLRDLHADYRAHGAAAIANLRRDEPRNYFQLVLSLYYQDVPVPLGNPESGEFSDK